MATRSGGGSGDRAREAGDGDALDAQDSEEGNRIKGTMSDSGMHRASANRSKGKE